MTCRCLNIAGNYLYKWIAVFLQLGNVKAIISIIQRQISAYSKATWVYVYKTSFLRIRQKGKKILKKPASINRRGLYDLIFLFQYPHLKLCAVSLLLQCSKKGKKSFLRKS